MPGKFGNGISIKMSSYQYRIPNIMIRQFRDLYWESHIGKDRLYIETGPRCWLRNIHYNDVIISAMASQITTRVCSTVCSGTDQRKRQSSASLAFVHLMTSSCLSVLAGGAHFRLSPHGYVGQYLACGGHATGKQNYWVSTLDKPRFESSTLWHKDHFMYAPSQWETTLQYNVFSYWLGACSKWSLYSLCLSAWVKDSITSLKLQTFWNTSVCYLVDGADNNF